MFTSSPDQDINLYMLYCPEGGGKLMICGESSLIYFEIL